MYKFTNGLIFFTKEEADKAIEAGYHLIEKQIDIEDTLRKINEEFDETNKSTNEFISKSNTTIKKSSRKNKRSDR